MKQKDSASKQTVRQNKQGVKSDRETKQKRDKKLARKKNGLGNKTGSETKQTGRKKFQEKKRQIDKTDSKTKQTVRQNRKYIDTNKQKDKTQ